MAHSLKRCKSDFPKLSSFYDCYNQSSSSNTNDYYKRDNKETWIDKFEPKKRSDLAVSKQKVNELCLWFDNQFINKTNKNNGNLNNSSPFLLLKGPTGCGKTITVKILCKEYNVELVECQIDLSTVSQHLDSQLRHQHLDSQLRYQYSISQTRQFEDFINKANQLRSSALCFDNDQDESIKTTNKTKRKLILIEEFPTAFYYKPKDFHDILLNCYQKHKCRFVSTVFIISELTNGHSDEHKLLPNDLQSKLNFKVINFNKITDIALTNAINKLCHNQIDKIDVKEIVETSSGDIRSAINNLQVKYSHLINNDDNNKKNYSYSIENKRKKLRTRLKPDDNDDLNKRSNNVSDRKMFGGKDSSFNMLHNLGKILYAKRGQIDSDDNSFINDSSVLVKNGQNLAQDNSSNNNNNNNNNNRKPLNDIPENIANNLSISRDVLISWLYQNYIDFVDNFDEATNCIDWLSDVDSMELKNCFDNNRSICDEYRSIIAIRGLMYNLPDSKAKNRPFRHLNKPFFNDSNRITNSLKFRLSSLLNNNYNNTPPTSHLITNHSLILDYLPLISKNQKQFNKLNHGIRNLIEEICFFNDNKDKKQFQHNSINSLTCNFHELFIDEKEEELNYNLSNNNNNNNKIENLNSDDYTIEEVSDSD